MALLFYVYLTRLGSRVVSVLNSCAEGSGLKSQSRRCRVTVLGKLFTPTVPLVAVHLRVAGVTVGLAAYPRVYDSRHLQADCREPESAPVPCARQSSMGYLFYRTRQLYAAVRIVTKVQPVMVCRCSRGLDAGRAGWRRCDDTVSTVASRRGARSVSHFQRSPSSA